MTRLDDLETPVLVLDAAILERNIERMRARTASLGVALRPHVKTPKCIEVARKAMAHPSGPITVSTLKEAEYFLEHGVTDILYAVGVAPNKLAHIAQLRRRGADIKIILDNVEAAHAIVEASQCLDTVFPSLIEIDCDDHRSGVKPGDALLLRIASALRDGGVPLRGVMTHAGNSYNCTTVDTIRAMAEQERKAVVRCAETLRASGHPIDIVSVGSTPTATYAEHLDGVTEARAGVYVFFDLVMAGLDVCRIDDLALSVLVSVIGHQRDKGWIITDGGWMAMSRDRGTSAQRVDQGYGLVCDRDGVPIDDLIVTAANQEHGIVARRGGGPLDAARFPLGRQLRVLPNHACATGAQHGAYHVVRGSRAVEAIWTRLNGW